MEKTIMLLQEKNKYLEKFLEINDQEINRFFSGDFNNLEDFYNNRERILDLIKYIDDLIDDENRKDSGIGQAVPPEVTSLIAITLRKKDEVVGQILNQDLQILAAIEKEKSNIINELRGTRRAKKVVQAYHSGEVRNQLDEEA